MPDAGTHDKHLDATNSADAITFLQDFDPTGWHNLVAIPPEGGDPHSKTFPPGSWSEIGAWAEAKNALGWGVYFTVNEVRPNPRIKKPGKADIARIRAVFLDVDPDKSKPFAEGRADLLRLLPSMANCPCPPTYSLDSGGGLQFFWRLADKLPADEFRTWAEDQSAGIARLIGGDAVQNIDRVMRLPGTINYPKPDKLARGQQAAPARVLAVQESTYAPDALSAWVAPVRGAKSASVSSEQEAELIEKLDYSEIAAADIFADLPPTLRTKFLDACKADEALRALWAGEKGSLGEDTTGSGFRASLAVRLARSGLFVAQEFGQLVWVWPHALTPGKDRDASITPREIARCWLNVAANKLPLNPEDWFAPVPDVDLNPFEQAAAAEQAERAGNNDPARFQFLTFGQAVEEAMGDGNAPLIKGLLDQGAMSVLYGDSNAGKTFVALDIAYHIWQGLPYAGMRTAQGAVVYVAAEGGRGIKRRLRALAIERKPKEIGGFDVLPCSINLLDPDVDLNAFIGALLALSSRPSLVVVDTLARTMAGGDENASTDMGAFVRNVDAIRAATGAHVMVIHHTGKDRAKGARGHSSLRAATDTELEVERGATPDGKPGGTLSATKQRDMEGGQVVEFVLRSVPLGFDADGDPVTSAVAVVSGGADGAGVEVVKEATPAEEAVLDCLRLVLSTSAAPARGATTADIQQAMGKKGNAVRALLHKLKTKGHVVLFEGGLWAPKGPKSATETAVAPPQNGSGVAQGAQRGATDSATGVFG